MKTMRISLKNFSLAIGLIGCAQLNAQYLLSPNSIKYPLSTEMPNSVINTDESSSLEGYVKGSVWGAGKKFDYANMFSEFGLKGEATKGFTEGYGFVKADLRVRNGEFYNENKTEIDVRDLYAGFKNDDVQISLGNQNVQWGRGIGGNPTNNLSPSNGFLLTTDGDDQKMYNFMLNTKYNINSNLALEVIGIPVYKMNISRMDLLNIPVGVGEDVIPNKTFKNGAFATRLNLNGGPLGASISYFNGYSATPGINTGYIPATGPFAFNQSFKKQVLGADFMWRFPGGEKSGKAHDPRGDLMVAAEVGYSKIEKIEGESFVPKSNLEFSFGLIKEFWDAKKLDKFAVVVGYDGKYTSDYKDAGDDIEGLLAQQMFGQYAKYVQKVTGVFMKTLMNQKLNLTLVTSYGITPQPDNNTKGHSYLIYPQMTWNMTNDLHLSAGYFNLGGAGSNVV
ncbi:MAG: hypothetical protein Q8909_17475, partial [Bacteroidota bacterium]|nr:hypothetical protein [Bacteroidota bacterium]